MLDYTLVDSAGLKRAVQPARQGADLPLQQRHARRPVVERPVEGPRLFCDSILAHCPDSLVPILSFVVVRFELFGVGLHELKALNLGSLGVTLRIMRRAQKTAVYIFIVPAFHVLDGLIEFRGISPNPFPKKRPFD